MDSASAFAGFQGGMHGEELMMLSRIGRWVSWFVVVVGTYFAMRKIIHYLTWRSFKDGPYVLGVHQWRPGNLAGPHWCNICQSIVYGIRSYVVKCDICGMYAHAQCAAPSFSKKSRQSCHRCKKAAVLSREEEPVQKHVWIKGNIDPTDTCSVCGLFCGSILALSGMKCAWCHLRVHEKCFQSHSDPVKFPMLHTCDFGRHRKLILPPYSVLVKESSSRSQRAISTVRSAAKNAVNRMNIRLRRTGSLTQSELKGDRANGLHRVNGATTDSIPSPPKSCSAMIPDQMKAEEEVKLQPEGPVVPFEIIPPPDTTPLLVFVNSRSGGQMGIHVLRQIRKWLNPIQVYDLSHKGPHEALLQFKDVNRLRIVVCGGDGTVGWILGALDEIGVQRQPAIAVLPLGTGNDLARVLGWGSGISTSNISDMLYEIEQAHVTLLDRWRVDLNGKRRGVMNNYLGVGVDAQVVLEFHETRERSPGLFMTQFINKLWYTRFGAKNFLFPTCAGLPSKITLVCDGETITLPEGTEGVILLNIKSYGGGSTLWYDDSDSEEEETESEEDSFGRMTDEASLFEKERKRRNLGATSPHDGLLDVVAVYGTLHLGQMQVGLSRAVRLCQCKTVSITLKERLPVQFDGEPWLQEPCQLDVTFHQQAFMLSRTIEEKDVVTKKVGEVLDWAENTHVISSEQRDVLLAEIARRVTVDEAKAKQNLLKRGVSSRESSMHMLLGNESQ